MECGGRLEVEQYLGLSWSNAAETKDLAAGSQRTLLLPCGVTRWSVTVSTNSISTILYLNYQIEMPTSPGCIRSFQDQGTCLDFSQAIYPVGITLLPYRKKTLFWLQTCSKVLLFIFCLFVRLSCLFFPHRGSAFIGTLSLWKGPLAHSLRDTDFAVFSCILAMLWPSQDDYFTVWGAPHLCVIVCL